MITIMNDDNDYDADGELHVAASLQIECQKQQQNWKCDKGEAG